MIKKLTCINDAIIALRKAIIKILNVKEDLVLNGESVRGVELTKVFQAQEIPLTNGETIVIFYLTATDEMNVFQETETTQSYAFHITIYGCKCRKQALSLRTNLYNEKIKEELNENGVSISDISTPNETSEFINNATYVLRNDLDIYFNSVIINEQIEEIDEIDEVVLNTQEIN